MLAICQWQVLHDPPLHVPHPHELEALVLKPLPPLYAKADIRRLMSLLPHLGQVTPELSFEDLNNSSNLASHLLQLNSKIGIMRASFPTEALYS
jgi:hypothetical protein